MAFRSQYNVDLYSWTLLEQRLLRGMPSVFCVWLAVQGEFMEQAEKARERANKEGGAFQEKFQELKKT